MSFKRNLYQSLDKTASFFSLIGGVLSIAVMFLMTIHIIVEIVLRSVFSSSTYVLDEMVGYGVAAMTFLSLGYAFRHLALIRVGILSSIVKSKQIKKYLELFCVTIGIFASYFILKYFYLSVLRHFARGSRSETIAEVPLWIPETLVCIGLAIFMLELVRRFFGVLLDQESSVQIAEGAE
ncbi:TRAP transporter small permease [Oligella urethralis]|uniref:TRAP transporter small permease subunit n=1 Tax=Oligella urethralis TaxID=90245 RepID=UPI000D009EE1|nr:TRAP transporter small permease [Oligella urethralis]AVL71402.1 TRAP transporter small permease [Oligella urethralis]